MTPLDGQQREVLKFYANTYNYVSGNGGRPSAVEADAGRRAKAALTVREEAPEPAFTIKAKDDLALRAVDAYRALCVDEGLTEQAIEVVKAYGEMVEWRIWHPGLCHMPDHEHKPVWRAPFSADREPTVPEVEEMLGGPGAPLAAHEDTERLADEALHHAIDVAHAHGWIADLEDADSNAAVMRKILAAVEQKHVERMTPVVEALADANERDAWVLNSDAGRDGLAILEENRKELQEARKRIAELEANWAAYGAGGARREQELEQELETSEEQLQEALDLLERLLVPAAMFNEPLKLKRNAREILARNGRLTEGDSQRAPLPPIPTPTPAPSSLPHIGPSGLHKSPVRGSR